MIRVIARSRRSLRLVRGCLRVRAGRVHRHRLRCGALSRPGGQRPPGRDGHRRHRPCRTAAPERRDRRRVIRSIGSASGPIPPHATVIEIAGTTISADCPGMADFLGPRSHRALHEKITIAFARGSEDNPDSPRMVNPIQTLSRIDATKMDHPFRSRGGRGASVHAGPEPSTSGSKSPGPLPLHFPRGDRE